MRLYSLILILFLASAIMAYGGTPSAPHSSETASAMESTISGQVLIKGKSPMVNGVVLLFDKTLGPPPHPYKYWRIPDMITGTDKNGKFSIMVPEGTYYLMIAQKKPGGEIGPPKEKEFLYFHGDAKGNPKPIIVSADSKVNLGVLSKSFIWSPKMVPHDKDITAIVGVVTNMEGKPVEGAVVLAYLTQNTVGRPAFISDRTDYNGNYQLRVYEGGTYYLKVRSVIGGGTPAQGEYQSATEEFMPVEVSLSSGQLLKGVTLKVDRFSGKGLEGTQKPAKVWKNTGRLQSQ